MMKRLFWLLVGMGFGFGMSFWVVRALRQTVERYAPPSVLRGLSDDLRAAAREGRDAMRARERELRAGGA
ncbi:MAG TPA: hypothetical protein VMU14_06050 [Acidimicrobiales bacterium]|nr:hypothetical protein [Acidimicrobiales bacterium]